MSGRAPSRLQRLRDRWLARRLPAATSVQLTQRSIFIVPTTVGMAFLVALLLMLLAAINYRNSLAYAMTFLLASVFAVTLLHTWRNMAGLRLQAGRTRPVFCGERAHPWVRLESGGRTHQAVALGWPGQTFELADVPARGACEVELTLSTTRRGWLRPPRLRVESRFPLGLFVAWSWVDLDLAVLVYPWPVADELPLQDGSRGDEEGRHLRGAGADDYQGLSPWQPGVSRRRLHWKAYSRGQGLLVKEFAAVAGRDLMLDYEALGGDAESRLSRLCHWVQTLTEQHTAFGLRLPGRNIAPAQGRDHADACLRALALHGVAERPTAARP
ncbi:DUF58 domain-containing protein [Stutzerimonas azotifigens]|uniref:DUF58 domain-containing protein n=1 Tax=Stutzerimonas azotifigens TaxID=291995 RepID=UPI0003F714B6|nr:DUF58 domain-containing protein [Stutzerimonas azotifigens]